MVGTGHGASEGNRFFRCEHGPLPWSKKYVVILEVILNAYEEVVGRIEIAIFES